MSYTSIQRTAGLIAAVVVICLLVFGEALAGATYIVGFAMGALFAIAFKLADESGEVK